MTRTADRRYRRRRARVLAGSPVCAACGKPIDKTLKFPHPMSATADHVHPVGRGGSNLGPLQPMHLLCNQRRGTGIDTTTVERHTHRW